MRRPSPPALFFILSVLCCGGAALAEYGMRPPLTFRADDRTLSFGNTSAAPDVSISWETTGAEDHLSAVVASGAGLLVSSDADTDRSGSIAAGATYLGVCSDDAASPTECVVASHDGTNGIISTISGSTIIQSSNGTAEIGDGAGSEGLRLRAGATSVAELIISAGGDGYIVANDGNVDQGMIAVGPTAGTQVNLTLVANYSQDHDHAEQTNPTLFIHSATAPDTDNTQWGSFAHNQTDFVLSTGLGNVNLTPAGEFLVIDPGTNSAVYQGDVTEIQTTDATQTSCTTLTIATNQIVHLRAMVIGIVNSTGVDQASYEMVGTFHNVGGGGATQVGTTTSVHLAESAGAGAWAAAYTLAGAIVRASVTGASSTTINWACSLEYLDR